MEWKASYFCQHLKHLKYSYFYSCMDSRLIWFHCLFLTFLNVIFFCSIALEIPRCETPAMTNLKPGILAPLQNWGWEQGGYYRNKENHVVTLCPRSGPGLYTCHSQENKAVPAVQAPDHTTRGQSLRKKRETQNHCPQNPWGREFRQVLGVFSCS